MGVLLFLFFSGNSAEIFSGIFGGIFSKVSGGFSSKILGGIFSKIPGGISRLRAKIERHMEFKTNDKL